MKEKLSDKARACKSQLGAILRGSRLSAHCVSGIRYMLHRKEAEDRISEALSAFEVPAEKATAGLKRELYFCQFYYRISPEEYFRYHFENLSDTGRRQYVGDAEISSTLRKLTSDEMYQLFRNKIRLYERFKQYYAREAAQISGAKDHDAFVDFSDRHETFIVKPISSYGGHGVWMADVRNGKKESVFRKIVDGGDAVIEELIVQDERMAAFHPGSVNTVRVVTCNHGGGGVS